MSVENCVLIIDYKDKYNKPFANSVLNLVSLFFIVLHINVLKLVWDLKISKWMMDSESKASHC